MKTAWTLLSLNLLVLALAAAGGLLYLAATHRLNSERLHRVTQIFKPTLAQEKAQREAAEKEQVATVALVADATRKNDIAGGNPPLDERLEQRQHASEIVDQRIERLERVKADLLRQLQMAEERIAKSQAELDAQRAALAQAAAVQDKKVDDRDYQATIEMLEQLKSKQAKEIFENLMRANKTKEVVDYLAAMQPRKAAAVLKEFKTPAEVDEATRVLELLRRRGVNLQGPISGSGSAAGGETPPAPPGSSPANGGVNTSSRAISGYLSEGAQV